MVNGAKVAVVLAGVLGSLLLWASPLAPAAAADEGWSIRSFDVTYEIDESGAVKVTEDLLVDFGSLQRHGIFRDIPVEYQYDSQYNRVTTVNEVTVDDGADPWPFEVISGGPNLRIKIGDPDRLVTGEQRYRISYVVLGGLNPFPDHDEFYWNVTGNAWPVMIGEARATVRLPAGALERIACYEGATGSTLPCQAGQGESSASFVATTPLPPGAGLTIVVGLRKGVVQVPPLVLVPARVDPWDDVSGFLGLKPLPLAIAAVVGLGAIAVLARLWWVAGRDRWFGDMFYAKDAPAEAIRPLFAHETIVVEYGPPEVTPGRKLRPAEVGVLMDERADTLDVSATIVDLAVRGHLRIEELEGGGILGLFKSRSYQLTRTDKEDGRLLPYEQRLLDALFATGQTVKLDDLKNKFYKDLAKVKDDLYQETVAKLNLFPHNPETVRLAYHIGGAAVAAAGATSVWLLGAAAGAGVIGFPIATAGAALFLLAPAMPRRSATGRLLYRRCLGFRRYMVTAETERQRFAERSGIFHEYLPYAIVFGCVRRWAKAFEGLAGQEEQPGWYSGPHAFAPVAFADSISTFSSGLSQAIASTPGGSGGSGFGGSSGGGGGGGGGGSW
jgi:uncharacterized membrane protein YgcG